MNATEPEAAQTTPPAAQGPFAIGDEVGVRRFTLTHDVVKRLPVDEADRFPTGQKVNLFIEAYNQSGTESEISVSWEHTATGRRSPATRVRIGKGKVYRTRAYRTMRAAGSYRAIVEGPRGDELVALPFEIVAGS